MKKVPSIGRIYFGGRLSRPTRIIRQIRLVRQNKHGNLGDLKVSRTTLKNKVCRNDVRSDALDVSWV